MNIHNKLGFSLVEILVSLFVVSIAAVNISGLQKMVGEQNRDNFTHTAVIELATEKFEEVMDFESIAEVDLLHDADIITVDVDHSHFSLDWTVTAVTGAGDDIREVALGISWKDATDSTQTFIYSEQISLSMLLQGGGGRSGGEWDYTIPNLLGTNKVNYFEPKMGYKNGSYVIYNSQLFKATSVHSVGSGQQRDVEPPVTYNEGAEVVSNGWENLGSIDNSELASLFTD